MKKFIVNYEQVNTLEIEVEAINKEEAFNKADKILSNKTFEDNIKECQQGYFEHTYTDEKEE